MKKQSFKASEAAYKKAAETVSAYLESGVPGYKLQAIDAILKYAAVYRVPENITGNEAPTLSLDVGNGTSILFEITPDNYKEIGNFLKSLHNREGHEY